MRLQTNARNLMALLNHLRIDSGNKQEMRLPQSELYQREKNRRQPSTSLNDALLTPIGRGRRVNPFTAATQNPIPWPVGECNREPYLAFWDILLAFLLIPVTQAWVPCLSIIEIILRAPNIYNR